MFLLLSWRRKEKEQQGGELNIMKPIKDKWLFSFVIIEIDGRGWSSQDSGGISPFDMIPLYLLSQYLCNSPSPKYSACMLYMRNSKQILPIRQGILYYIIYLLCKHYNRECNRAVSSWLCLTHVKGLDACLINPPNCCHAGI
jgi:hypothetical protein